MVPTIQDTAAERAVSNQQTLFDFTSNPTARGPERSLAGLASDTIMVRFASGYQAVHVSIASYSDGVRIIACAVAGELARIWDYGDVGFGIEIKSVSTPSQWHTVTPEGCDCLGYQHRGHCRHMASGRAAEQVYSTWRYAERVRDTNARRAAAGKANLSQYDWEGAVA